MSSVYPSTHLTHILSHTKALDRHGRTEPGNTFIIIALRYCYCSYSADVVRTEKSCIQPVHQVIADDLQQHKVDADKRAT